MENMTWCERCEEKPFGRSLFFIHLSISAFMHQLHIIVTLCFPGPYSIYSGTDTNCIVNLFGHLL